MCVRIRVGLTQADWCPYRKTDLDSDTHTQGRWSCKDRSRDRRDKATSRGMPGAPGAGKDRKVPPLEPSEGGGPADRDFGPLASRR